MVKGARVFWTDSGVVVIGSGELITLLGLVFIIGLMLGMWAHYFLTKGQRGADG